MGSTAGDEFASRLAAVMQSSGDVEKENDQYFSSSSMGLSVISLDHRFYACATTKYLLLLNYFQTGVIMPLYINIYIIMGAIGVGV